MTPENNGNIKQSISTITNILLGIFIGLILLLIASTYNQLKDTEASFKTIASEVVPTLANNGIAHSQLSSLAFLVANFAQAASPAQMRISHREVTSKLEEIERLVSAGSIDIDGKLALIRAEFDVLNSLILEVFALQQILEEGEQNIYQLQSIIQTSSSSKRFEKIELLLSTLRIIYADKLIDVRRLQRNMETQLQLFSPEAEFTDKEDIENSEKINQLVFGRNGIIDTKLSLVRTRGRVKGQRNFVRRLILDVASDTEFKTYEFANLQSEQAEKLAYRSSERFSVTLTTHIVTFLIGLGLIIFIKFRVVSRLESLTKALTQEQKPEKIKQLCRQNDEISVLTKTVVKYISTIDKQKAELTQLSFMDSLTKVGNRRAFNERMEQAISLAMRNKLSLSVLLIDVDCFKQFNDEYGHVKGDECLIKVAQQIKTKAKRSSDFVARYGGEEFVCLMIGMTCDEALEFAESLCTSVEELAIPHLYSKAKSNVVTVSVGVHCETDINSHTEERLLQCSDVALYQAKTNGRNQAVRYLG